MANGIILSLTSHSRPCFSDFGKRIEVTLRREARNYSKFILSFERGNLDV
jgi:hypothetical protein